MANPFKYEFVLVNPDGERAGDVGSFIIRLLRANGGYLEPTELRASKFLGSGHRETRAIGAENDALYGFGGMYAVHQIIESLLPDGAAGELEGRGPVSASGNGKHDKHAGGLPGFGVHRQL